MELRGPYLALIDEHSPQRRYSLREVFNALRWLTRAGAAWRLLPHDFPPWEMVYQQFRRGDAAGCLEAMVSDMRSIIRTAQGRKGQPSAVILDDRTKTPCKAVAKAGLGPVMTATSGAMAPRYIWLWIRWDFWWR